MDDIAKLKFRRETRRMEMTYCSACNEEMHSAHILICAECLNDDCEKFADFFEKEENEIEFAREE